MIWLNVWFDFLEGMELKQEKNLLQNLLESQFIKSTE